MRNFPIILLKIEIQFIQFIQFIMKRSSRKYSCGLRPLRNVTALICDKEAKLKRIWVHLYVNNDPDLMTTLCSEISNIKHEYNVFIINGTQCNPVTGMSQGDAFVQLVNDKQSFLMILHKIAKIKPENLLKLLQSSFC